jgi:hypothetical protein
VRVGGNPVKGQHLAVEGQHLVAEGQSGGEAEDDAHLPSMVGKDGVQPSLVIPLQRRGEDSWGATTSSSARPIIRNQSYG